jgi:hypothetical protein
MLKSYALKIIFAFVLWRIALFIIAYSAILILPIFGNRFPYWDMMLSPTGLPSWIWGFGNFDGVHYLRIVTMGYESSQYSQAFFPLYPIFIKIITWYSGNYLISLISTNFIFLLALFVIYKLFEIDFSKKTAFYTILLLLIFPTSFYFGSIYSESIFLFFVSSFLYLLRKKNYLAAGIYGFLACSTRILGLWLILVYLIEVYLENRNQNIKQLLTVNIVAGLLLIPLGLILYMFYLGVNFNDPLLFLNSQPAFGAERNNFPIILFPQVFYRYIKMILTIQWSSLLFFNVILELIFALFSFILLLFSCKKIRFSYWLFSFGCWLTPTLTGTFSSMPRYVLMMFLLLPLFTRMQKRYYIFFVILFIILGMLLTALFTRGYWVA